MNTKKTYLIPVAAALLMIVGFSGSGPVQGSHGEPLTGGDPIEDEVVILFNDTIPNDIQDIVDPYGSIQFWNAEIAFVNVLALSPSDADALIDEMHARDDVEHAYKDRKVEAHFVPNDPRYEEQWGPPKIGMEQAWEIGKGSHNVTVGVVGKGIDQTHEDLDANVCEDPINLFGSSSSHETQVSGIIAAEFDSGVGITGIGDFCLMDLPVFNGPETYDVETSMSELADGIAVGAHEGADVISISYGGPGFQGPALLDAIAHAANDHGVVIVASAGDSGCSSDIEYPANFGAVIAVASVNETLVRAGNCGEELELVAPGIGIMTTTLSSRSPGYVGVSGTSYAAPHVAGVAALIKDISRDHPGGTFDSGLIRCILDVTATDLGPTGRDVQFGFGLVNAEEAAKIAADQVAIPPAC